MRNAVPLGLLAILCMTVPLVGIPALVVFAIIRFNVGKSGVPHKMRREADQWAQQPARWQPGDPE